MYADLQALIETFPALLYMKRTSAELRREISSDSFSDSEKKSASDANGHHQSSKQRRFLDPNGIVFERMMLILPCLIEIGSFVEYYVVGSCEHSIQDNLNITSLDFSLLYSVYSTPNVILVFIGGFFLDYLGIGRVTVFFVACMASGGGLIFLSAYWKSFRVMAFGMFLLGMGSESTDVATGAIAVFWCSKNLGLAMGLIASSTQFGTFLAFFLNGHTLEVFNDHRVVLGIGALFCGISFMAALTYFWLEWRASKVAGIKVTVDVAKRIKFSQVRELPRKYWCVAGIMMAFITAQVTFLGLSSGLLQERGYSESTAKSVVALISAVSLFLCPVLGWLFDRTSRRALIITISNALLVPCFILLGYSAANPVTLYVVIGIIMATAYSALMPELGLSIPDHLLGTGLGLSSALDNIGLCCSFALVGYLDDLHEDTPPPPGVLHHERVMAAPFVYGFLFAIAAVFSVMSARADVRPGPSGPLARSTSLVSKLPITAPVVMSALRSRSFSEAPLLEKNKL